MAREFSAYFETFVTQRKDGKAWDFLVRVYSYAPQPGFIQNLTGNAPSEEKAKAAGKAAGQKALEKFRIVKKEGA